MQDRSTKEKQLIEQLRRDFSETINDTKISTQLGSFSGLKITRIFIPLINLTPNKQSALISIIDDFRKLKNFSYSSQEDNYINIIQDNKEENRYITHLANKLKSISTKEQAYTRGAVAGMFFYKVPEDIGLKIGSFLDGGAGAKLARVSKKANEMANTERNACKR